MKYGVVVVLYNSEIENSVTYNSIKKNDVEFLFVDNSTNENNNGIYCKKKKYNYISMHGNKGLSKAYNCAFDFFKKSDCDYVILFDDDSKVESDFFNELDKEAVQGVNILVPLIRRKDDLIIGPRVHSKGINISSLFRTLKPLTIEKLLKYEKKNILVGINSGMVISREIFMKYIYDEKLFLDYVDRKFCDDMHKGRIQIKMFYGSIYQDFHFDECGYEITESIEKRILGRKKDLWVYSKGKYFFRLTYILLIYIKNSKNMHYLKFFYKK